VLKAEEVHQSWKHLLDDKTGLVLDVGAGCGRDSRWFINKGWDVVAVEPCKEFRIEAIKKHINYGAITWVDDKLPKLGKIRSLDYKFNLILVSAVWMHLSSNDRLTAFRILADLLAPGGHLIITLRHSKDQNENKKRKFHTVSREELEHFSRQRAVVFLSAESDRDQLQRSAVSWETCVMQLPDDGTGNLPLLRHIIVNDNKSSTYKLALLRSLVRIAEGAPGMVVHRDDDFVTIPLGLVALYWIKLYSALLLRNKISQSKINDPVLQTGLSFAKQGEFYALSDTSRFDLRIGGALNKNTSSTLIKTLKTVCTTIKDMPVKYTTYPGTSEQVFQVEKTSVKKTKNHWQINKQTLSEFGSFRIPAKLWTTMGSYACWVEPTIINEWVRLMMGYEVSYDKSIYDKSMQWEGGNRDTSTVRKRIETLLLEQNRMNCVWSNRDLRKVEYHVDHCFPWSRWANNDLWNLMPADARINLSKSEKLPSALQVEKSKECILNWWEIAYLESNFKEQFIMEAETALPGLDSANKLEDVFQALKHQRTRLRSHQQLVEWNVSL